MIAVGNKEAGVTFGGFIGAWSDVMSLWPRLIQSGIDPVKVGVGSRWAAQL